MRLCPVCDTKTDSIICLECGFDRSTDVTHFPTFAPVSRLPAAPSALRQEREILRCPGCGGSDFGFRIRTQICFCKRCRQPHPPELLSGRMGAAISGPEPEPIRPALAAGAYHTVFLRADGTILTAGSSDYGQRSIQNLTTP